MSLKTLVMRQVLFRTHLFVSDAKGLMEMNNEELTEHLVSIATLQRTRLVLRNIHAKCILSIFRAFGEREAKKSLDMDREINVRMFMNAYVIAKDVYWSFESMNGNEFEIGRKAELLVRCFDGILNVLFHENHDFSFGKVSLEEKKRFAVLFKEYMDEYKKWKIRDNEDGCVRQWNLLHRVYSMGFSTTLPELKLQDSSIGDSSVHDTSLCSAKQHREYLGPEEYLTEVMMIRAGYMRLAVGNGEFCKLHEFDRAFFDRREMEEIVYGKWLDRWRRMPSKYDLWQAQYDEIYANSKSNRQVTRPKEEEGIDVYGKVLFLYFCMNKRNSSSCSSNYKPRVVLGELPNPKRASQCEIGHKILTKPSHIFRIEWIDGGKNKLDEWVVQTRASLIIEHIREDMTRNQGKAIIVSRVYRVLRQTCDKIEELILKLNLISKQTNHGRGLEESVLCGLDGNIRKMKRMLHEEDRLMKVLGVSFADWMKRWWVAHFELMGCILKEMVEQVNILTCVEGYRGSWMIIFTNELSTCRRFLNLVIEKGEDANGDSKCVEILCRNLKFINENKERLICRVMEGSMSIVRRWDVQRRVRSLEAANFQKKLLYREITLECSTMWVRDTIEKLENDASRKYLVVALKHQYCSDDANLKESSLFNLEVVLTYGTMDLIVNKLDVKGVENFVISNSKKKKRTEGEDMFMDAISDYSQQLKIPEILSNDFHNIQYLRSRFDMMAGSLLALTMMGHFISSKTGLEEATKEVVRCLTSIIVKDSKIVPKEYYSFNFEQHDYFMMDAHSTFEPFLTSSAIAPMTDGGYGLVAKWKKYIEYVCTRAIFEYSSDFSTDEAKDDFFVVYSNSSASLEESSSGKDSIQMLTSKFGMMFFDSLDQPHDDPLYKMIRLNLYHFWTDCVLLEHIRSNEQTTNGTTEDHTYPLFLGIPYSDIILKQGKPWIKMLTRMMGFNAFVFEDYYSEMVRALDAEAE